MMKMLLTMISMFLGFTIMSTGYIPLAYMQDSTTEYMYDEFDALAPLTPPQPTHKPSSCEIFLKRCAIALLLNGIDAFHYLKARCKALKQFLLRVVHAS